MYIYIERERERNIRVLITIRIEFLIFKLYYISIRNGP